jgi:glucose-6-phosphate dehydrogenase assembly protein OpcA
LDCPVKRLSGGVRAELTRATTQISLSRPAGSTSGILRRTGQPDTIVALARRETGECLAEDLRRLDADEIYESALRGLEKVNYG